jgi:hypothetical protein
MWLFLRGQQNLNHMGCSDVIHGWMESFILSTTSFTICNNYTEFGATIVWTEFWGVILSAHVFCCFVSVLLVVSSQISWNRVA